MLTARADNPRDAFRFNEQLLEMSEATVNRLNERGRLDIVRHAEQEVAEAKLRSQTAATASPVTGIVGIVHLEKQAAVEMQMISKLQDQSIAAKTELAQLQRYTPDNPRIPVVATQMATIQGEINRDLGKVAGNRGSLAAGSVLFAPLTLENQFADKQLGAALASLEER